MKTDAARARTLFRLLVGLVLLGSLGGLAELLLEEHWEDTYQRVPLVLLGLGAAASGFVAVRPPRGRPVAFLAVMGGYLLSGLAGIWLHYSGNAEFEVEMRPSLSGFELFREAIAGATPALAPGLMIHLGLVGVLAAWVLARAERPDSRTGGSPE